jgi:hypothetical protein
MDHLALTSKASLWWTKCHGGKVFSESVGFPMRPIIIPPNLHIHLSSVAGTVGQLPRDSVTTHYWNIIIYKRASNRSEKLNSKLKYYILCMQILSP